MQDDSPVAFHGRERKVVLPPGWTPDGRVNGRPVYRCPFVHTCMFTGTTERCVYRERKDRINFRHKHVFTRSKVNEDTLTEFDSNEHLISTLRREAARFAARENLPASCLCRESMHVFILRVCVAMISSKKVVRSVPDLFFPPLIHTGLPTISSNWRTSHVTLLCVNW